MKYFQHKRNQHICLIICIYFLRWWFVQCNVDSYNCIIDCQYVLLYSCGCYEALEISKKNAILFLHLGFVNGDKQYCQPAWEVIDFVVCRLNKCSSIYTRECNELCNQNIVTPLNNLKHGAISTCHNKWTLETCINVCTNMANDNVTGGKGRVNDFSCYGNFIRGKNLAFILWDAIKNF